MDKTSTATIAILGRQPALGLAELESLYGAATLRPAGKQAALLEIATDDVDFVRLGGTIKLGQVLGRLPTNQWPAIETYLRAQLPKQLASIPDGKIKLGLSAYDINVTTGKLGAAALTLKKTLRSPKFGSRSVRVVPNKELELNSAQVLHNNLASASHPTGCEILIVRDGAGAIIARTTHVQDIDAYAARDQGRPKRDARVGMLPPKLAQTIVNLATSTTTPEPETIILDPFCGTGVVLQEATLMGFGIYGTDLEQRMIDFTAKNLEWLHQTNAAAVTAANPQLEAADATSHTWNPAPAFVAGETYLGQPFNTFPAPEKLEQVRSACNTIHRKFLQNIAPQLAPGTRLCLAVPAWQRPDGSFLHLSTLDHLEELGYNRLSFKHVETSDLIYARADQIVARELLVLEKIS